MRLFIFSSRSVHTRCAVVTGVQTCALPISIGISHESCLYAVVWGSSVDLGATDGVVFDDLNTKLAAYVGYKREVVPGLTADVGLFYYYYPKDSKIATDYFEPYVSLSGSLGPVNAKVGLNRSEEHTSELQSQMHKSNAVFC